MTRTWFNSLHALWIEVVSNLYLYCIFLYLNNLSSLFIGVGYQTRCIMDSWV
jgi:hypothetical protein